MTCDQIAEKLTEGARKRMEPGAELRSHLRSCSACRDRWDSQENLTAHIKAIRFSASRLRSPDSSRALLIARFAQQKRVRTIKSNWSWPRWSLGLATAAALILSIVALPAILRRMEPADPAAATRPSGRSLAVSDASAYSSNLAEIRGDEAADVESEGFMAVPFVPPLALGEMLRVVHTELNPAELASLGVSVDPAWTTQLPADLLLGEDGMPRAVKVSDGMTGSGGF